MTSERDKIIILPAENLYNWMAPLVCMLAGYLWISIHDAKTGQG